jgi:flavin reductase (DIM6/NTAB) family NADH-FMN oxidoreductase RutF
MLAPLPAVLVTCSGGGRPNALTIAWTGIINSSPPKTYISVRPGRYSYGIIKDSGVFVINLIPRFLARAADFCGVKSGRDLDKLAALSLTVEPSPALGCPMLSDSPLSLECRVFDILPLGSHDMFMADIVGVSVEESLVDAGGGLRLDRAGLVAFAHGRYYPLGASLGRFGFSVRKNKKMPGARGGSR